MENLKVVKIDQCYIYFEKGIKLYSEHVSDCCESHELSFNDLTIEDFKGLEFDLTGDGFFNRIEDYGIELIPIKGYSVKIPGYGYNNGYYSSDLELVIGNDKGVLKTFDITDCQEIES